MTELETMRLLPAQPGQRIARLRPHYEQIDAQGDKYFTTGSRTDRPNGVTVEFDVVVAWALRPQDENLEPLPITLAGIQRHGDYVVWLWDEVWQNQDGYATTLDDCIVYALEIAQEIFDREAAKRP